MSKVHCAHNNQHFHIPLQVSFGWFRGVIWQKEKSWIIGSGPGPPFGLEDKAPWTSRMFNFRGFTDSPHAHQQETRSLDTIQVTSFRSKRFWGKEKKIKNPEIRKNPEKSQKNHFKREPEMHVLLAASQHVPDVDKWLAGWTYHQTNINSTCKAVIHPYNPIQSTFVKRHQSSCLFRGASQKHRGKPLLLTISVLGSFTCITQHMGPTALRPIRRTKQLWLSVLLKDTSAATGNRTHILVFWQHQNLNPVH